MTVVLVPDWAWARSSRLPPSYDGPQPWTPGVVGFEIGTRALGRFSSAGNLNAPPGSLYAQVQVHFWHEHLIEVHAMLGVGITRSLFAYGVGLRLNFLELVSGPPTGMERSTVGQPRGLLSSVLSDFMIFGSVDLLHYSFPEPEQETLSYETGVWTTLPGAGIQWYLPWVNDWAQRIYIETSLGITRTSDSNYLAPFLGLGFELR